MTVMGSCKAKTDTASVTLCDKDDSGLCVVAFGSDEQDNMLINFHLPDGEYPLFYVKAANSGTVNVYSCEVLTADPTSVFCTGIRPPLGERLDLQIYSIEGDTLIAQGQIVVSSFIRVTANPMVGTPTPKPGTAYPNP